MKIIKGHIETERYHVPYRIYGNSPNRIVCISGAQQTMAVWYSFIKRFVGDYTIVTFDMPGLGRAEIRSGAISMDFNEQIELLKQVVDRTDTEGQLILTGASWGTIIASGFAARYPEQVYKLILGSFGIRPSESMRKCITEGRALYERNEGEKAAQLIIETFGQFISGAYKEKIIQQFKKIRPEQALAFYNHCDFVQQVDDIEEHIKLENIQAHTLIINGEKDALLDLEDVKKATTRIPRSESHLVLDAGHFLHFESPEIMGIYDDFLGRAL